MRCISPAVTLAGLLAFVPSALATISITGPGPNAYWVQNVSNQITWDYQKGDPNPIAIILTNPNITFLNGAFSIAQNVDLSNKSFTVTNVTLNVHSGYIVNFVNPANMTQVYAQSQPFELKTPGTPVVTQSTPAPPGASATAPPSKNSTASPAPTASAKSNGATVPRGSYADVAPGLFAAAAFTLLGALTAL